MFTVCFSERYVTVAMREGTTLLLTNIEDINNSVLIDNLLDKAAMEQHKFGNSIVEMHPNFRYAFV